jgi:hypothetical protein
MIKKSVFLAGILLLAMPFWFAVQSTSSPGLIEKINQDIASHPSSAGEPDRFEILDAAQYKGQVYPWIGYPVLVLYEDQLLGQGDNIHQPPDEFKIKELLLRHKKHKRIIFKIDSWNLSSVANDLADKRYSEWYLQILKWAHEVLPDTNFGFFGLPFSPWFALQKPAERMQVYQRILRLMEPVITASDSLYPDFFVKYGDSEHLFYSMISQIYVAKSYAKKVYPILWQRGLLTDAVNREVLPSDLLIKQCLFVKKYADGVVWWSELGEPWEDPWYNEVRSSCFE